ncbi:MAG TPA: ester cyclase [Anaerolineales bacterium]
MSTAENKVFAYRILEEIFSQGNLSNMEELFSPEMVIHDPDKELRGLEQVKQGIMRLRMAFPDLHYIAEDMIAEEDKVVIRFTGRGTHRGEFRGVPPTDKDMTYTGIMILRFVEKKAVEYWAVSDALGIYRQLGVILPSARSS